MPVILDWQHTGNHDDLLRQAVHALQHGKTILLPTEQGYVLAVAPAHELASGLPTELTLTRYNGVAEVGHLTTPLTEYEKAWLRRIWPSSVAVELLGDEFPTWSPTHHVCREVLYHTGPLTLYTVNEGQSFDYDGLGDGVALVLDAGVSRSALLTRVMLRDRSWQITRPGAIEESVIRERLLRRIVFVCTGNTCRSPMAEAIFKQQLANRLGCTSAELPQYGYAIASVGVATSDGLPASPEAVDVMRSWGIDLASHRSQMATAEFIAQADDLITMTRSHLLTLVSRYPVLAGSLRLLCGAEGDLDDPIGGTAEVYQACANVVRQHVERLITEMGLS